MERDFYRYLNKLDPDDRNDALITFLHLLDDGELSDLIQMSQSEQSNRRKRVSGSGTSVKRPESAADLNQNQSAAGRDMFKRLRMSVDTSTPIRPLPIESVTTPAAYSLSRRRLPAVEKQHTDLLCGLVSGQPHPDEQKPQNSTADVVNDAPDEDDNEEIWDEKLDAIIAAHITESENQGRESDATAAAAGAQADPAAGDTDPVTDPSDAAVATFFTGKFRKKDVTGNHKLISEFVIKPDHQIQSE